MRVHASSKDASAGSSFFFPYRAQPEKTEIHSDPSKKTTLFCTLDGETHGRVGFVIELSRSQGCQCRNTHRDPISNICACNTNVQTGDWG